MKKPRRRMQLGHAGPAATSIETPTGTARGIALGALIGVVLCAVLGLGVWAIHATGNGWLLDWILGAMVVASIVMQGHLLGIPLFSRGGRRTYSGTDALEQLALLGLYVAIVLA